MTEAYQKPGVYEREIPGRIFPSPIPQNNIIAMVTTVPPNRPFVEPPVNLTGTTAYKLQKGGILQSSIKVTNLEEDTEYTVTTDYTVAVDSAYEYGSYLKITRVPHVATETFTLDSGDTYYTPVNGRGIHNIEVSTVDPAVTYDEIIDYVYDPYTNRLNILPTGNIPRDGTEITLDYNYGIEDGEPVRISYRYADEEYYLPYDVADIRDVYERYGQAFDDAGAPNPCTLAAEMIFANTSTNTILRVVPVDPYSTGNKTQVNLADWQLAISGIQDEEVAMIVETSGSFDVHSSIVQHVRRSYDNNRSMVAVLGRDGTALTVDRNGLRAMASAYNYHRLVLVSTDRADGKCYVAGDDANEIIQVGYQYLACATAGLLAAFTPQEPLTRKEVARISTIGKVADTFLTNDTAAGLCVYELDGPVLRCRHGITTMFFDINKREISVVRAMDFKLKSMKRALDAIAIGRPRDPGMDVAIAGAATNVLERMRINYVIRSYDIPTVLEDPTDPTTLILRYAYTPNYPINRIIIEFAIGQGGAALR